MIHQHNKKSNVTTILWDSVAEPEQIANNPKDWSSEDRRNHAQRFLTRDTSGGDAQEWLGAPSLDALKERLQKGWADGVAKLEQIATKELASPLSVRRRRFKADQGDELDMQAVWRGDLSRSWTRTRRQNRVGSRSVSLIINLGDNCSVDSTKLFWRGASALKVAEQLSQAGYNVALYGVSASQMIDASGKQKLAQFVEIKSEDSPLDMDKLAAITAMPGFFRTSLFTGICFASSKQDRDAAGGLGRNWHEGIDECVKALPIPQNAIIQPPVLNQKAAEEWIDKVLEQIETPQLEAA